MSPKSEVMPVPRISGVPLRTLARAARTRGGAYSIYRALRKDVRGDELLALPEGLRGGLLHNLTPLAGRPPRSGPADLPLPAGGWAPTVMKIGEAYGRGDLTPSEVVRRCFEKARDLESRTPTHAVLLQRDEDVATRAAAASTERWRTKATLGPFDGVPCAIKEQSAVAGLLHQNGTRVLSDLPASQDAACVEALRAAGAIVLGTTPMTEYGMSPLGQNALRTMPRNPHAPGHLAGGSSTGSGVAVATGLVPFALGVDGGGSVRIPAAWNGVFGLKPTWGRVSRRGTFASGSMSHVGPLASSAVDLAGVLERIGHSDAEDPETLVAPAIDKRALSAALRRGVRGLRVGVEEREWADASSEMAAGGREALRALEREGAVLVPVRLELLRFAIGIGALNIGPEALALNARDYERLGHLMGHDVQVSFAALSCVSSTEFLDAQRLRTGLRAEVAHAFRDIDLLALPTTADAPPAVTPQEMASGFIDGHALARACRYAFLANLTGLPAGTAPVGKTAAGLPIGFQLVGDAWDEGTVLAGLAHLERMGAAEATRPQVYVDILG